MTLENLTTRHFEIFLAMSLSRNMAEASDKLGISQAAISKSLRVIERASGLSLFRLEHGRLVATDDAIRLLPFAQRAVDHLERARAAAIELQGGDTGRVVIGAAGPSIVSILPHAMARLRQDLPGLRFDVQIDTTRNLLDKVAGNRVDIGIGTPRVRDIDPRTLQLCRSIDICDTWLVAVMPKRHRLARLASVRPQDLAGEALVGLPEDSVTTQLIAGHFQQAGIAYAPELVVANAIGVCSMVQQGLGIGLLNPLALGDDVFPGLVSRAFRPRVLLRTCLYHSRMNEPSAPVAKTIEGIVRAARDIAERHKS